MNPVMFARNNTPKPKPKTDKTNLYSVSTGIFFVLSDNPIFKLITCLSSDINS